MDRPQTGAILFSAIFSFKGRLGRLAFLGWTAVATFLVFIIGVGFLLSGGVTAVFFSAVDSGPYILGVLMGLTAAVVGIWTTLALQAKRIRDMGFRPLPWMLSVSAVMIADQWLLTHLTDVRFFPPLAQYTPLGGLSAVAYMIVLLCWPSVEEPQTSMPVPRQATPVPPAPAQGVSQFGLRSRS
jgi:uncharacterized membrane protein YhaH (DUF805 family)